MVNLLTFHELRGPTLFNGSASSVVWDTKPHQTVLLTHTHTTRASWANMWIYYLQKILECPLCMCGPAKLYLFFRGLLGLRVLCWLRSELLWRAAHLHTFITASFWRSSSSIDSWSIVLGIWRWVWASNTVHTHILDLSKLENGYLQKKCICIITYFTLHLLAK